MSDERVVVVGGGAMGAATAWFLARSGHPVTLLEQYDAAHTHGSSHGSSRIFRFSYEDQDYVDLGVEAQGLWRTLEAESGRCLVTQVGCVDHGPREVVEPVHAALVARGVRCDLVSPEEAQRPMAGAALRRRRARGARGGPRRRGRDRGDPARRGRRLGADVRTGCAARAVHVGDDGVEVVTDTGTVSGSVVVLAAGAWLPAMLADGSLTGAVPPRSALPALKVTQEQPATSWARTVPTGSRICRPSCTCATSPTTR